MNTGTITKILGDATLDEFILNADSLNNIVENEELSEILKGYVALSDLDSRDFVTWSQLTSYNPDGANEIDPYFNSWYNSVSVRLNKLLNVDLDAKYAKTTDIPNYETDPKFAEMSGSFQLKSSMSDYQLTSRMSAFATSSWVSANFARKGEGGGGGGDLSLSDLSTLQVPVGIIGEDLSVISGNYVQTTTPLSVYNYSDSNGFIQAEATTKYGTASIGSKGFIVLGVTSAENKVTLSTNGTAISDIIPTSCYTSAWSIALDNYLDAQFSDISTVGANYVIFKKPFNQVANTNGKAQSYFIGLIKDDNALYCPTHPEIGNCVISTFRSNHIEGGSTHATAQFAHAEGRSTFAEGRYSHAEGHGTIAAGTGAHAEGMGSKALENRGVHAEGWSTVSFGNYGSHSEGCETSAVGTNGSHAEGYQTKASDFAAHAEGIATKATGRSSHTEGLQTTASYQASHAEGEGTYATSQAAHSEGYQTSAMTAVAAHAEGAYTKASGNSSHAEGKWSYSIGTGAHAEGISCIANGGNTDGAHAEGFAVSAIGAGSHAEGYRTLANGEGSHAEGRWTYASGKFAHAEGGNYNGSSYLSGGWAAGNGSHAEGVQTYAKGTASHAEGYAVSAIGDYSHAAGYQSIANTNNSYANGVQVSALNYRSIALGYNASTTQQGQFVWNGYTSEQKGYTPSNTIQGSFNINPKDGISGFYIGTNSLNSIILNSIQENAVSKNALKTMLDGCGLTSGISKSDIELGNVVSFIKALVVAVNS